MEAHSACVEALLELGADKDRQNRVRTASTAAAASNTVLTSPHRSPTQCLFQMLLTLFGWGPRFPHRKGTVR